MRLFFSCTCAALLFALPSSPEAAPLRSSTEPVEITADTLTYEKGEQLYRAAGNVHILTDGMTLNADTATFSPETNMAKAQGKATLVREGSILKGDTLTLNLSTENGTVQNGSLFVKSGNFHILGNEIQKIGANDYYLERGSFTTCNAANPSWRFGVSSLNMTLEGLAVGKNAIFYIDDIPLFYLPYIAFPVNRERQSGFLLPRIGTSSLKGFYAQIDWYQVISPSQDMTIEFNPQTKRGMGGALEYRYIRQVGSDGTMNSYFIYDTQQDRWRGDLLEKHEEIFSSDLYLKSNISLVSDQSFLHDYGEIAGEYNRQLLDSSIFMTKNFVNYASLTGEVRYVDDLYAGIQPTSTNIYATTGSNRATLQKLPTISLTGVRHSLYDLPLYVSLDTDYTNFYRPEGTTGERLRVRPTLTWYGNAGGLDLSAWGGWLQRNYRSSDTDNFSSRGEAEGGVSASTTLSRVFSTGITAMPRLRHVMIPEVGWNYQEPRGQNDLPSFDNGDRTIPQSRAVWSLSNFFTGAFSDGNGGAEYRDLLYLRLSQGYDISGGRSDFLTTVDREHHLSDLRIETRMQPLKWLAITTDGRYDFSQGTFASMSVGGDLKDQEGNTAGVGYQRSLDRTASTIDVLDPKGNPLFNQVNYLEANLGITEFKPFAFTYLGRYSIDRRGFLESNYTVEYRHQCWTLGFSYLDRLDNREFLVSFSLSGLGSIGKLRAF